MRFLVKILYIKIFFIISFFNNSLSFADNHNVNEILEQLQQDIKTLEKAVYSGSAQSTNESVNSFDTSSNNSEDVLTRHL